METENSLNQWKGTEGTDPQSIRGVGRRIQNLQTLSVWKLLFLPCPHGFVENGVRPEDVLSLQMGYFPLP